MAVGKCKENTAGITACLHLSEPGLKDGWDDTIIVAIPTSFNPASEKCWRAANTIQLKDIAERVDTALVTLIPAA